MSRWRLYFGFELCRRAFYPNGQYDYCSPANGGNEPKNHHSPSPTRLVLQQLHQPTYPVLRNHGRLESGDLHRSLRCLSLRRRLPDNLRKCRGVSDGCRLPVLKHWATPACPTGAKPVHAAERVVCLVAGQLRSTRHRSKPAGVCLRPGIRLFRINELAAGAVNRTFPSVAVAVRMEFSWYRCTLKSKCSSTVQFADHAVW